jgi:hypothetical protein
LNEFLSRCTTQVWTTVLGQTVLMASGRGVSDGLCTGSLLKEYTGDHGSG